MDRPIFAGDSLRLSLPVVLFCLVVTSSALDAQTGDSLLVFDVQEAGEIYDPADASVVRYVTGLTPSALFFEARSPIGIPLGSIRRAPDLSAAPPVEIGLADTVTLFDTDGVTPIVGPFFHPVVSLIDAGDFGLYVIDALPAGNHMFFTSTDGGSTWVLEGAPLLPLSGGGSGIVAALRVPNLLHVDGFEVRVYYQTGGGAIRMVQSASAAPGAQKFITLDASTDTAILEAIEAGGPSGFSPTGDVVELAGGSYGFFFVPQTDDYIGFAEASDGIAGWTVTRGADDPLLSTSANSLAPDPARPEIKEVSVVDNGTSWTLYFDGAIAGGALLNRAVGSLVVSDDLMGLEFIRGDGDADGGVGVGDAIYCVNYLFMGGPAVCLDALDSDDSGLVDLGDAIYLLNFLFMMGTPPAAPYPGCGPDLMGDTLDCSMSVCL